MQDDAAEEGYDVLPDVQRQQQQPADSAGPAAAAAGTCSAGSSGSGGSSSSSSNADDEVARVQAFLSAEQDALSLGQQQQQQLELQTRLVCTFTALPRDLQVALISSPARRQLLDDAVAALQAGGNSSSSSGGVGGVGGSELTAGLQQLQHLMQELTADCS
jgi:hypothetical protein